MSHLWISGRVMVGVLILAKLSRERAGPSPGPFFLENSISTPKSDHNSKSTLSLVENRAGKTLNHLR